MDAFISNNPYQQGLNLNNLLGLGTTPAPQTNPSAYQPGGFMMQRQEFRLPYNPADIFSKVNQSVGAPNMAEAMQQMPGNTGIAANSPARAYLASMRAVAPQVSQNANIRAMLPLQYGAQNASSLLQQQIAAEQEALGLAGMQNAYYAQQQQQGMGGLNLLMGLLNPFLGQLTSV